ncbi:hypothetical protein BDR06DRAFT_1023954 [Suillus hirtellus]|nr:hypothetical protein BDR06DRAFT_1023954 [Suillus hirtellus]
MDVDVPDASSSSIKTPLFSAQLSPVVPEIDNLHTLEDENGDANIIVAANKGKTRDTNFSSRANGKKKDRKQADVELDNLAHKSPMDEPAAGNNGLEDDGFVEEEETKAEGKRFSRKVKMRTTVTTLVRGHLTQVGICPRTKTRDDNPKGSEIIVTPEITKIPPKTIAPPPKQTLSSSSGVSTHNQLHRSQTVLPIHHWIAPLHPNRRTPPPPLLRPPPKKSNKKIEMEERIEEDLSETVEGWSCMIDEERRDLRRARIDAELCYE